MDKKKIYHIIEWVIALAACAWLVWKMATYDDYAGLWAALRGMGGKEYLALALALALMPVNMSLEAWRWKTLMNGDAALNDENDGLSFAEAQRQVYYSKLAGLITPWRLGEYPARGLMEVQRDNVQCTKDIMARVLSMGTVGSATMTAAIVIAGIVGLVGLDELDILDKLGWMYYAIVGTLLVLMGIGLYFAPQLLRRWATVSHKLVAISLGQSLVRLENIIQFP